MITMLVMIAMTTTTHRAYLHNVNRSRFLPSQTSVNSARTSNLAGHCNLTLCRARQRNRRDVQISRGSDFNDHRATNNVESRIDRLTRAARTPRARHERRRRRREAASASALDARCRCQKAKSPKIHKKQQAGMQCHQSGRKRNTGEWADE